MTAERESMTLQEMDAPALGVEERRDEATPSNGTPEPATLPEAVWINPPATSTTGETSQ